MRKKLKKQSLFLSSLNAKKPLERRFGFWQKRPSGRLFRQKFNAFTGSISLQESNEINMYYIVPLLSLSYSIIPK